MILLFVFVFSLATAYFVQESGEVKSDDALVSIYEFQAVPSDMINEYFLFL